MLLLCQESQLNTTQSILKTDGEIIKFLFYVVLRPYGLPLRGFAITLIGYTTLGKTPLDE